MFAIILLITPSFLTLTGGEIQIGIVKSKLQISISESVPAGIDLELKFVLSKYTTLKLVQSI